MKKLIPVLTALVITGLILTVLFKTGILQITNENGKKTIDIKGLTTSTNQKPESLTFIQHMQKADEYLKKGMTTLAFNEYIAANEINPTSTEPYRSLGKLLMEKHDYARAQEIFQQLLVKDPTDTQASMALVQTDIMLKDPEKAQGVLKAIQGDSQQKSYLNGLLAAYSGDYDNAKKYLGEAIKSNTEESITSNAKKVLSAFDEYNLNQGSQEIFLKTLLAKNFNQVGQYTLSIPLLFKVVKEKKDYRDAWILLGYAYLNIDDTKNATDALQEAKKLDGNKPETLFFLGLAYSSGGQKEIAARTIEEAITKGFEPKIQAQQKLAEIYLELKDYQKSAAKYENVIALNDADVNYYIRPMWLYIDQLHQPAQALTLAKTAVAKHPESSMAQNLLGWAYLATEDFAKSREALAKSLEIDPTLPAAYLNLGKLYQRLTYNDTAKEYYRTAIKLGEGTSIGEAATDLYGKLGGTANGNGNESTVSTSNPSKTNILNTPIRNLGSFGESIQANIIAPQGATATAPAPLPDPTSNQPIPKFTLPPLTTAP